MSPCQSLKWTGNGRVAPLKATDRHHVIEQIFHKDWPSATWRQNREQRGMCTLRALALCLHQCAVQVRSTILKLLDTYIHICLIDCIYLDIFTYIYIILLYLCLYSFDRLSCNSSLRTTRLGSPASAKAPSLGADIARWEAVLQQSTSRPHDIQDASKFLANERYIPTYIHFIYILYIRTYIYVCIDFISCETIF